MTCTEIAQLLAQVDWASYAAVFQTVFGIISALVTIFLLFAGTVFGWRKYRKNTFYDVVTYSLNGFRNNEDGTIGLAFRTQLEGQLSQFVPHNRWLHKAIEAAAKRCHHKNMFMCVNGTSRTQEMFLNSVSSHWLAQESADGDLMREMGMDVIEADFWIGVTFEPYESPSARKIRVMIIHEKDLESIDFCNHEQFVFENPTHADRIDTLRVMQEIYRDDKRRATYLIKRTVSKRL